MAGPTPVSALIHAATMVTAGVYLIVRLNFIFVLTPTTMTVVALTGLLTALLAGSIGLVQNDIKKVLAWSTVSQLGFMFLAAGVGGVTAAFFHLVTHAFFKALLFLGSGSVIHALSGEQDIRRMGGLRAHLPSTHTTFLIGCLAIAGFPLTAGFFSKDEILWAVLSGHNLLGGPALGLLLYPLAVAAAFMTALYMFRLYFMVFGGTERLDSHAREHLHESPAVMTVPLWILAALSLVAGFAGLPHVIAGPTGLPNLLHHWIAPVVAPAEALIGSGFEGSAAAWACMLGGTVAGLGGIFVARSLWGGGGETPARIAAAWPRLHRVLEHRYYIDEAYALVLGRGLELKSKVLGHLVDGFALDTVAVNGTGWLTAYLGRALSRFQNGSTQRYVAFALAGLALILLLMR
jgi:NADH-quinone oxidoreductase subunit L